MQMESDEDARETGATGGAVASTSADEALDVRSFDMRTPTSDVAADIIVDFGDRGVNEFDDTLLVMLTTGSPRS
jgi:hypothetical protein